MRNFVTKIFLSLIFLCVPVGTWAQSSIPTDSIQSLIEKAQNLQETYNYEQALEIAKTALTYAKYKDDSKSQGLIYKIIAYNFEANQEYDKAVKNYDKAKTYASLSKSKELESYLFTRIANIYVKSDSTRSRGIRYYDKAIDIAENIGEDQLKIEPLLNTGETYIHRKEFKTAYPFLSRARKIINKTDLNQYKAKVNRLLAEYFLNIRRYPKAQKYVKEAINFANKDDLYAELADAYKIDSDIKYAQKKYKLAFKSQDRHHKNIQKSNEEKRLEELQKLTVRYEVEKMKEDLKDAEEEVVEKEIQVTRSQLIIILGTILVAITLIFLISSYRNNLQKKKLNNDLIEKNKELKIAKDAAEQVSTLKSQFISTVSHELRTPLYGVIGLTSLLMENPIEKKKKEYLDSLKFSGDYLLALINDVLQLSKIETKEVTLEETSFGLRTLIEGIVNSLHSKSKHNNNIVHIEIDQEADTTLLGDSVRISQILMNLIGNALKFTRNGNIRVIVNKLDFKDREFKLRFMIKDDGIGIPKEKQATIFDNFTQAKNIDEQYQGTGLGLSIVKKLIELHNSEIFIESEENEGATFYFDLYLKKAVKKQKETTREEEDQEIMTGIGTSKFNILIVDDNKINQIVTQNILKKKGYTCSAASNGQDAIDLVKEQTYDLILMDVNMPGMTGLEATQVIRTFNDEVPVIALTAVEEGEIRDEAIGSGMNDVIIKPYDTQQFFQTIIKNITMAISK